MRDNPSDDVVRLVTAANPMEAHVIEHTLRDRGIACKVVGDYLDAGLGDLPGIRAEVWVHQDDVAAAEAILNETRHEFTMPEENEPEP